MFSRLKILSACVGMACAGFVAMPANAQEFDVDGFTITIDGGWSHIHLPSAMLGSVVAVGGTFPTIALLDNAETDFQGYGLGFGIHTRPVTLHGIETIIGLKGFYSDYSSRSKTVVCPGGDGTTVCEMYPMFDPDPTVFNLTTSVFRSEVIYVTNREPSFWGVSLEALFPNMENGIPGHSGIRPKAGLAFKRLSDDLNMAVTAREASAPADTNASYSQEFSTSYFGGYIGATGEHPITDELSFIVDGEAGIYWAHSRYDAAYASDQGQFLAVPPFTQNASLSEDNVALILKARAELQRRFERFSVSGFVEGQFISYAPMINFNQIDRATIQVGSGQDGTEIGEGRAYNVTAGVRLTVPLQ